MGIRARVTKAAASAATIVAAAGLLTGCGTPEDDPVVTVSPTAVTPSSTPEPATPEPTVDVPVDPSTSSTPSEPDPKYSDEFATIPPQN